MGEAKPIPCPVLIPPLPIHRDPPLEALLGTSLHPGVLGPRDNVKYCLWTKDNKNLFLGNKVLG